jgi:hypothetical protein
LPYCCLWLLLTMLLFTSKCSLPCCLLLDKPQCDVAFGHSSLCSCLLLDAPQCDVVYGCSSSCYWLRWVLLVMLCLFLGVPCCDFSFECSLPCYCFFLCVLCCAFSFGCFHHEALWALFAILLAFGTPRHASACF